MDLTDLRAKLETAVDRRLSASRAAHTRGVARLAGLLCEGQGIDPLRGMVAGLGHDLCKEMSLVDQEGLFSFFLHDLGNADLALSGDRSLWTDALLHGPAAAALLFRDYGLRDPDILEALAFHTTGRPGMGLLATITYCADKLEPGRKHVDEAFRRRCLAMPPADMLLAVVEDTIQWLRKKEWEIAPQTFLLYNALRKTELTP